MGHLAHSRRLKDVLCRSISAFLLTLELIMSQKHFSGKRRLENNKKPEIEILKTSSGRPKDTGTLDVLQTSVLRVLISCLSHIVGTAF